ncbi:hypothetical protein GH714_010536 [Hevea brasiliensis]|uniref:Pentatricopeptide repeat-containing protein n=1 Tax=Hevea brasiliensis TaxID=3981 RepID=A0A6A6MC13_HEVBR|nr:hypothetical protein GH714_010536 [Hevea brasiliensis]
MSLAKFIDHGKEASLGRCIVQGHEVAFKEFAFYDGGSVSMEGCSWCVVDQIEVKHREGQGQGFSPVKVSRIETELSESDAVLSTSRDLVHKNLNHDLIERNPDSKREIRKNYRGAKKGRKRQVGFKFNNKRNSSREEREEFFVHDTELDVNYSVIHSNLSLEQCNFILKKLERCSCESKTLRFFEWMKSNGKLEENLDAYNAILRVLGSREDWDFAERMIREVSGSFGTALDFRVFNTLIYVCSKRGLMELGGKWFRMMLELGVQPNMATFGMLMGLFQKGWNVEEQNLCFPK